MNSDVQTTSEMLFNGNNHILAISNQPVPNLHKKGSLSIQKYIDVFNCELHQFATQISKCVMFQLRQHLNSAGHVSGTELN